MSVDAQPSPRRPTATSTGATNLLRGTVLGLLAGRTLLVAGLVPLALLVVLLALVSWSWA